MGPQEPTDMMRLCDRIRQAAYELHVYLGGGMLEQIYQRGLAHRLRKLGLRVETQRPLEVRDEDGEVLGDYFADIFVEDLLIIEIKACKAIADEHIAQILGYMRAAGIEHGLLINFGGAKFEIRKFISSKTIPPRKGTKNA